jgi:tyrosinase
MQRNVSDALTVAIEQPAELALLPRADLVFYGVDHSGSSYEGRVFFNRPDADISTPRDLEHGYAGSFFVFGHGRCYGEVDHCDPHGRHIDEFDARPSHPLTPWTLTVIVTEALQHMQPSEITVTVVAVDHQGKRAAPSEALAFDHLRLLLYEP